MSLETELKKLTAAVDNLAETLKNNPQTEAVTQVAQPANEPEAPAKTDQPTAKKTAAAKAEPDPAATIAKLDDVRPLLVALTKVETLQTEGGEVSGRDVVKTLVSAFGTPLDKLDGEQLAQLKAQVEPLLPAEAVA